ncbi:immunoglobulin lambda-1 light chain-like [Pagrus major]|uniref:immunoglobulin lambda-1 light chain-like n=1 Tax=Pagrus major TaxID=143350 RepID=UPI003CC8BE40
MLFLPAAALCCLCSALVAMAAQLIQDQLSLTRRVGGNVSFRCRSDKCDNNDHLYWYQKKDTFRLVLDVDRRSCKIDERFDHPQKDDFSVVNKTNGCELEIQTVKLLHSATYYCGCWEERRGYDIFSSGTKLFVTGEQVVKPVVSVYPAASRAHLEGKSSLLCVASAMFPPLVRFSWNRRKENEEEWLPAEGEQLELRESGRTAAILLVDGDALYTYKYRCSVQHEGGTVEAQTEQGNEGLVTVFSSDSASCGDTVKETLGPSTPPRAPGPSQYQVKMLCVLYTVLIVKSLVYCCGLSLLMIL